MPGLIKLDPEMPPEDVLSPVPQEWTPEWVVDTWRRLYAVAPTPALMAIVDSAAAWLESQKGGDGGAVPQTGAEPLP